MIPAVFYDIESLENLFTIACFTDAERDEDTILDIYYLLDNEEDVLKGHENDWMSVTSDEIYKDNQNFHGQIRFYNLKKKDPNFDICSLFSCDTSRFMNDKKESDLKNSYRMTENGKTINPFRIKCDTDSDYDENTDPYFFGYNSYQYDTTMMAHYFQSIWTPLYDAYKHPSVHFHPCTAAAMRTFNNELFEPEYKSQMYTRLSNGGNNYSTNEYRIRKNMLMSGRHVDVARLNEKQSKVGLKRLLGMLGFQILESSKLSDNTDRIEDLEQFADLVAYNCSDVINLKGLFYHPQYQAQFELKRQLLKTYPELVYNRKPVSDSQKNTVDPKTGRNMDYIPDAGNSSNVKSNRLFIDSSSAQFSTNAFCPYDHLTDTPVVSFVYPSTAAIERAKKSGKKDIPEQKDVLEEVNDFFNESFKDKPKLRAQFNVIYQYYSWMRGKNFNDSNNYSEDYNMVPESADALANDTNTVKDMMNDRVMYFRDEPERKLKEARVYESDENGQIVGETPLEDVKLSEYYDTLRVHSLKEVDEFAQTITGHAYDENGNIMPKYDTPFDEFGTCIPYYDKDGNATSCFVLFSTGGIHGAEYNVSLYESDMEDWKKENDRLNEVKKFFNDDAVACRKMRKFTLDGEDEEIDYKPFLKSGKKVNDSEWKDLSAKKPQLFTKDAKGPSLNKKYVYTSIGEANHADFPSYYPNLIIWLSILYNQNLNYDRVEELFGQKSEYGKLMKDKSLSEEDRRLYKVLREGTKLLLNSASGAADATFENNIRNNNQIIAMRCIGQMFAWLIGQDLTLKGALVPSTNTDGLYTFMPKDENDKALKEETEKVGISIEAEQVGFVSKDSNNRMEINMDTGEVMTASGGTLGCWQGPNPAKALSHPAVVDWALSEYLVLVAENYQGADMDEPLDITKPLDREVGKEILLRAAGLSDKMESPFDMDKRMLMFQNIIASSPSSHTYIYGVKDGDTEAVPLQHYNRIFLMSDGTNDTWHLQAAVARKVTPAMQKKRMKTGDKPTVTDLTAKFILDANGEDTEELHHTRDITTKKCTNLDPEWPIRIENRNLSLLSDSDKQDILDNLDFDKYVDLLESAYNHNWMNHTPGQDFAVEEENPEEDI